jgi:ADP-ribose pyrophosphatase YjhB (NUDIX family)
MKRDPDLSASRETRPTHRPIVSAHAVIIQDGRVLLIRRGRPPGEGRWSAPGGRVEPGEPARETVRRELQEECGIEVEVGEALEVIDNILPGSAPDGAAEHYVVLYFQAELLSGQPRAGSDAAAVGWFSEGELASLDMHPAARRALTRLLQAQPSGG